MAKNYRKATRRYRKANRKTRRNNRRNMRGGFQAEAPAEAAYKSPFVTNMVRY